MRFKTGWMVWVCAAWCMAPALGEDADRLGRIAKGNDVEKARAAITALDDLGAEGVPHLIAALGHPDEKVWYRAYGILLDKESLLAPHAQDLVDLLQLETRDPTVQVENLLRGGKTGVPELRAALRKERDPKLQSRFVECLGYQGRDASAAADQVAALDTTKHRGLRHEVIEALGYFRKSTPLVVRALGKTLESDDGYTAKLSAEAVERIAKQDPSAAVPLIPNLIEAMRQDRADSIASRVLRRCGEPALEPLLEQGLRHEDSRVRMYSAMTLPGIGAGEDRVVAALIGLIEAQDDGGTLGSLTGLGMLGPKAAAATELLCAIASGERKLDDTSGVTRSFSLEALAKVAPERAVDVLLGALDDRRVGGTAARHLGGLAKTLPEHAERIQAALDAKAKKDADAKQAAAAKKAAAAKQAAEARKAAEAKAATSKPASASKPEPTAATPARPTPARPSTPRAKEPTLAEQHPEQATKLTRELTARVERWIKARRIKTLTCRDCKGEAEVRCTRCKGTRRAVCPPCRGAGSTVSRVRGRRVRTICSTCDGATRLDCPCEDGRVDCEDCVDKGVAGYRWSSGHRAFYDFLSKEGRRGVKRIDYFREVVAGRALAEQVGKSPSVVGASIEEIRLLADRATVELSVGWPDGSRSSVTTTWIRAGKKFCLATPRDVEPDPLFE